MKRWFILMTVLTISALLMGLIGKHSFRDNGVMGIRTLEDVRMLDCNVNQIFTRKDVDAFINDLSVTFSKNLPDNTNVLIVKPTNNIRQYDFTMTQEVKIIEVLTGSADKGSLVELVADGGVYDQKYKYHNYENSRPIYFAMMNIMFPDNLYLVFVNALNINNYTETMRYRMAFSLISAFNITDDYSITIDKPANEIRYNDFGNSEFLCDSYDTLEKLIKFKQQVIDQFLTSDQLEHLRTN